MLDILSGEKNERNQAIGFQFEAQKALIDDRYKLVYTKDAKRQPSDNGTGEVAEWELYDLINDPGETENIIDNHPQVAEKMKVQLKDWVISCEMSNSGNDY
jgi:arylsulfatase A-like enzyme